ncbi:DoxX family protein [Kribbella swartbergensis]
MSLTRNAAARDLVLLLSRIGLGVVFIAHGWQKFQTNGLDRTAAGFEQMGVPAPTLSAYYAAGIELLGGVALILGLLTPVVGVLLALDMAGALVFVHLSNGVFVGSSRWCPPASGTASGISAYRTWGKYAVARG